MWGDAIVWSELHRPVSDLRNKFTEIESAVREDQPVYLTKNGYGSMVVFCLQVCRSLPDFLCS